MYQQYKEQIKYLVWLYAGAPSPAAKKKKVRPLESTSVCTITYSSTVGVTN
jgi:hypothetical protein